MYANLRINRPDDKPLFAFEITVMSGGVVEVQLDGQDSGGRDPEPTGTVYLAADEGPYRITADF